MPTAVRPARRALCRLLAALPLLAAAAGAGCGGDGIGGPDALRPQYYDLQFVNNGSLPALLFTLPFGGRVHLQSATLVPYAVGRTIDQRLINDRTGRGGTGGNTRDTSVARGQMIDLRILLETGDHDPVLRRDSTLVDVEVRDTVFIITRPHPDPARVRKDTGFFVDDLLVVPTLLDYSWGVTQRVLSYKVTR
jgi:hypothetical protein